MGDDDIDLQSDQFDGQGVESFVSAVGPAVVDGQVTSFDVSEVTQPSPHRIDLGGILASRGGTQETDPIHFPGRLRFGSERRKNEIEGENDHEPDQPHGHLRWGSLAGSLAEGLR
jgi:hypothetical protein